MNLENFSKSTIKHLSSLLFWVKEHEYQHERAHISQILDNLNIEEND